MDLIVDRSQKEAALAAGAAWAAFQAALVFNGDVADPASFIVGGCIGLALVLVGFAAASRCRPLPNKAIAQRARIALLALGLGAGLGVANLAANLALAKADPAIHAVLAERLANLAPVTAVLAAPVTEEVALRLFLMSVVGWVVSRVTTHPRTVFVVALAVSTLVFALLHLGRAFPGDPTLAAMYGVAVVLKYGVLSLVLGWAFWRWGLPYGIICHSAANAMHVLLQPMLF